jgi:hypothetical protein
MPSGAAGVEIAALRLRLSLRADNPRDTLRWRRRSAPEFCTHHGC